ncbi:MAG: hypothetical protein WBK78_06330 [Syntrophomonadaceae bacterium]|jgi:hypothetical protein
MAEDFGAITRKVFLIISRSGRNIDQIECVKETGELSNGFKLGSDKKKEGSLDESTFPRLPHPS